MDEASSGIHKSAIDKGCEDILCQSGIVLRGTWLYKDVPFDIESRERFLDRYGNPLGRVVIALIVRCGSDSDVVHVPERAKQCVSRLSKQEECAPKYVGGHIRPGHVAKMEFAVRRRKRRQEKVNWCIRYYLFFLASDVSFSARKE